MSKYGYILLIATSLLFSIGILMVFNTTSAEVLDKSLEVNTHRALLRQVIYGIIGICIGLVVYSLNYKNIIRLSPLFLFFCIIMLILVFIPKIGVEINGAKRWISVGGISLQPSEFTKYIIPIYFIHQIIQRKSPDGFISFLKMLLIFILPILLILLEPDNGTTAIIVLTLGVVFVLTKIKTIYWVLPLLVMVVIGASIAYNMPHVPDRINAYLHPELDIKGKGHQPYQAKIATGSGRIFGKGLGQSLQKLNYLPEARSDYIAAIYAEEFGFVGMMFMILLYMMIAYSGFCIAGNANDKEGFYLSALFSFLISFQAFLNLGVTSGLLPSKGTTLPFFSQGGTSLIINIMAIFILMNIDIKTKQWKKV